MGAARAEVRVLHRRAGLPLPEAALGHAHGHRPRFGAFRWQVPLGEIAELTKRGVPKTGAPNIGGSIVTDGGLVFIAATNDRRFRAFDRDSGRELWSAELPASGFATPATYRGRSGRLRGRRGRGGNEYDKAFSGQIVAFALPQRR